MKIIAILLLWTLVFCAIVVGTTLIFMPPDKGKTDRAGQVELPPPRKALDESGPREEHRRGSRTAGAPEHSPPAAENSGRLRLTVLLPEAEKGSAIRIVCAELENSRNGATLAIGPFVAADGGDGTAASMEVEPGVPVLTAASVDPGSYILHVEIEGCQSIDDPVLVRQGVLTEVVLRFIPADDDDEDEDEDEDEDGE